MPGLLDVLPFDIDRRRPAPVALVLDLLAGFSTPLDAVPAARTAHGIVLVLPRAIRPPVLSSAAAAVCGTAAARMHDRQRREWDELEQMIKSRLAATRRFLDTYGPGCDVVEARFARSSLPRRHTHQAGLAVTAVVRAIGSSRVVVEESNPLLPAVERLARRGSPLEVVSVPEERAAWRGRAIGHATRGPGAVLVHA